MNKANPYPMLMTPVFKDYIWGGSRLREGYHKRCDLPVIAESWEVSTHPDGLSVIANGEYAGQTLRSVIGELPVLVKIIDAREPLSVQVHPDDEYARRAEKPGAVAGQQRGKNEMWYVLEAEPGAELVLGFNEALRKDELRALIESGNIMPAVRRVPVKAGDCFTIPAGLVHSVGKGIVIAEVQQCSNLTYRVYDYGRTDSAGRRRELHIEKAMDVIDTKLQAGMPNPGSDILADWEYFRCELIKVTELGISNNVSLCGPSESGIISGSKCLTVINGSIMLKYNNDVLPLRKGSTVFIPDGTENYTLETDSNAKMLLTTI